MRDDAHSKNSAAQEADGQEETGQDLLSGEPNRPVARDHGRCKLEGVVFGFLSDPLGRRRLRLLLSFRNFTGCGSGGVGSVPGTGTSASDRASPEDAAVFSGRLSARASKHPSASVKHSNVFFALSPRSIWKKSFCISASRPKPCNNDCFVASGFVSKAADKIADALFTK